MAVRFSGCNNCSMPGTSSSSGNNNGMNQGIPQGKRHQSQGIVKSLDPNGSGHAVIISGRFYTVYCPFKTIVRPMQAITAVLTRGSILQFEGVEEVDAAGDVVHHECKRASLICTEIQLSSSDQQRSSLPPMAGVGLPMDQIPGSVQLPLDLNTEKKMPIPTHDVFPQQPPFRSMQPLLPLGRGRGTNLVNSKPMTNHHLRTINALSSRMAFGGPHVVLPGSANTAVGYHSDTPPPIASGHGKKIVSDHASTTSLANVSSLHCSKTTLLSSVRTSVGSSSSTSIRTRSPHTTTMAQQVVSSFDDGIEPPPVFKMIDTTKSDPGKLMDTSDSNNNLKKVINLDKELADFDELLKMIDMEISAVHSNHGIGKSPVVESKAKKRPESIQFSSGSINEFVMDSNNVQSGHVCSPKHESIPVKAGFVQARQSSGNSGDSAIGSNEMTTGQDDDWVPEMPIFEPIPIEKAEPGKHVNKPQFRSKMVPLN